MANDFTEISEEDKAALFQKAKDTFKGTWNIKDDAFSALTDNEFIVLSGAIENTESAIYYDKYNLGKRLADVTLELATSPVTLIKKGIDYIKGNKEQIPSLSKALSVAYKQTQDLSDRGFAFLDLTSNISDSIYPENSNKKEKLGTNEYISKDDFLGMLDGCFEKLDIKKTTYLTHSEIEPKNSITQLKENTYAILTNLGLEV